MNYNDPNGQEKKNFFRLPGILRIDPDKPVPFRQQLAVMCTMLIISCLLFTVVFIQQKLVHGNAEETVQISAAEEHKPAAAPEEKKPPQVSTVQQESKKEQQNSQESKKEESITTEASASAEELIGEMKTVSMEAASVHSGELILVNKDYSCRYDGENVKPLSEMKSDSYVIIDYSVELEIESANALNSMMDDFENNYGDNDVMVACGYRSYDTQIRLYNSEKNNTDDAEQWVAPPGYSEHQTGYVFDLDLNKEEKGSGIDFDGKGYYSWLNKNCQDYGFIVRYIAGKEDITGYNEEPWHFRYVGLPHSRYITEKGLALEEYIGKLHQYTADKPLVINDADGSRYCVYYTPLNDWNNTDVKVPANGEYKISGDNYSGFIVTVKLD